MPTGAEREKAARGGASGQQFPWGDTISHTQANYFSEPNTYPYPYDVSASWGNHPTFFSGEYPFTSPVGYFTASASGYPLKHR